MSVSGVGVFVHVSVNVPFHLRHHTGNILVYIIIVINVSLPVSPPPAGGGARAAERGGGAARDRHRAHLQRGHQGGKDRGLYRISLYLYHYILATTITYIIIYIYWYTPTPTLTLTTYCLPVFLHLTNISCLFPF